MVGEKIYATQQYVDEKIANLNISGGVSGGISVEDDGEGNVTLTSIPASWIVTDDGAGNVEISMQEGT